MNRRKRLRTFCQVGALALAVAIMGCDDDDTNPTEPEETPDFPRITETFTGEFGLGGRMEHNFTVENPGDVELKIVSLEPLETLTVGMGIGTVDETLDPPCNIFASDNRVVLNSILLSSDLTPGEYCVSVGDVGNVFPDQTVIYMVEVLHP
jgi:hypothetical protein